MLKVGLSSKRNILYLLKYEGRGYIVGRITIVQNNHISTDIMLKGGGD